MRIPDYVSEKRVEYTRIFGSPYEQWKFGAKYQLTLHDPDDDQEATEVLSYNELLYRLAQYGFADQFNKVVYQMWGEYNGTGEGLPSLHTPFLDIYLEAVV